MLRRPSKQTLLAGGLSVLLAVIFAYNVRRNYVMPDDAFISFRYAENLANGHGPVWNPGERVEGYSNFLWVVLMAAGLRLEIPPEVTTTVLNTLSGIAILLGLALLSARLYGRRSPLVWVLPLVLVSSTSFTAWCSGGLATMFFTALTFFGHLTFMSERQRGHAWFYVSTLLFTLATLTRPEGLLHFGVAGLFFLIDLARRKRSWLSALAWGLPFAVVIGAHLLWRHAYYGYWLPNTYYAKVGGEFFYGMSLKYFHSFSRMYHFGWFLPLAIFAVVWRPRYVHAVFATIVALQALYVSAIGGDYLEFRFLVMIFPYLYWLIVDGIGKLAQLGASHSLRQTCRAAAAAVTIALVVTTATGRLESNIFELGTATVQGMQEITRRATEQGLFLRSLVDEGLLAGNTRIAVGGAGAVPYYSRLPAVDILGLNDAHIAHTPSNSNLPLAGHRRFASLEYLRDRGAVMWPAVPMTFFFQEVDLDAVRNHPIYKVRGLDGPPLPLRIVKTKGRYLIFMTLVPEEEFRRAFRHMEIIQ